MKVLKICFMVFLCFTLSFPAFAYAIDFQMEPLFIERIEAIRLGRYYKWSAYGSYGETGIFEWHDLIGVQNFCSITGVSNYAVAIGFVQSPTESFTFRFGSYSEPYSWCYSRYNDLSILKGKLWINDQYVGYCTFNNPDDRIELVGCE